MGETKSRVEPEVKKTVVAKPRAFAASDLSLASLPAVMPLASDALGKTPNLHREAFSAMRLHFQSARAEYVERRLNPHNAGVIELYCKLCLRLIVASRDEFVFPVAVKAHKCGRGRASRSQIG
jgi:hypothetical protein